MVNLDKLTYADNLANLDAFKGDKRHVFVQGDIGDRALIFKLLNGFESAKPLASDASKTLYFSS